MCTRPPRLMLRSPSSCVFVWGLVGKTRMRTRGWRRRLAAAAWVAGRARGVGGGGPLQIHRDQRHTNVSSRSL